MDSSSLPAVLLCLVLAASPVVKAATPVDVTAPFTDENYHEYLLYNMDQPEVDVLILPSASPYPLRDVQLMDDSVKAWDAGIDALGPNWLANGLNLHGYRVGIDPIPDEALWDPEVVIVPAEVNYALLFGIGLEPMNFFGPYFCHNQPPPPPLMAQAMVQDPDFHQHEGNIWGMLRAECDFGGTVCFAVNTNFLRTPTADNRRDMYDLNSHEFGHCLGIGHVGDAADFTASTYPQDDIMSYEQDGWDPGEVLCVSSLNILALEQIYGKLLGETGYPNNPAGGYVWMDPSDWEKDACDEPTALHTDLGPVLEADPLGTGGLGSGEPPESGPLEEAGGWNRPVEHGCDVTWGAYVNPNTCDLIRRDFWQPDNAVDPMDEILAGVLCAVVPGSPPELGCP